MRVKQLLLLSGAFLALSTPSVFAQGEAKIDPSKQDTVSTSKSGWISYFNTRNFVLPQGVSAWTAQYIGDDKKGLPRFDINPYRSGGQVVKGGTAVLLKGAGSTKYTVNYTDEEGVPAVNNQLRGYEENHTTEGGKYYYRVVDNDSSTMFTFAYGDPTGKAFDIEAHRAYLPVQVIDIDMDNLGPISYFDSRAYQLPKGLKAGIAYNKGRESKDRRIIGLDYIFDSDGGYKGIGIVPAGTGVIISEKEGNLPGESRHYELKVVSSNIKAPENNFLRGSDEGGITTGGKYYYRFTISDDKKGTFEYKQHDGSAFEARPHQAYLPIPVKEVNIDNLRTITYFSGKAYQLADGLEAAIVKTNKNEPNAPLKITGEYIYKNEGVVPAKTGVLLTGNEGAYELEEVYSDKTAPAENELRGSDVAETTTGGEVYYRLVENDNKTGVVFEYGAENGAAYVNKANRAYLPTIKHADADKQYEISVMSIGGTVSGIDNVQNTIPANGTIYRIDGTRVQAQSINDLPAGIYIVNGKKIIK